MSRYYASLVRINNQRTVPYSPNDLFVKFCSSITFPKLIADKALTEMQAPTFIIQAGPNMGQPDLAPLVDVFEELWQAIYDRGIEIKPQAAPKPPVERSSRVDGMSASTLTVASLANHLVPSGIQPSVQVTNAGHQAYQWTGIDEGQLHEAYIAVSGTEAFAFLRDERNCWVCKGYGHTRDKCPSDPSVKRPLRGCIQGL